MLAFQTNTQAKSCLLKPVSMNPALGALERTHKLPQAACFICQDSEAQGEKLTEGTQRTEEQEDRGIKERK